MLKKASANQLKIPINIKPTKHVFQCKTLSVTLDENRCWKSYSALCKKVSSGIYVLKDIRYVEIKNTLICVQFTI